MNQIKIFITLIFNVVIGLNANAQELYHKTSCTGTGSANQGNYTYEATLEAKSYAPGLGDIRIDLAVSNYKITSFTYKGVNASSIKGVKFPINIQKNQVDVNYSLKYYSGNISSNFDLRQGAVRTPSYGNYQDLSSSQVQELKTKFNIKDKSDFNRLKLKINSCKISKIHFEQLEPIKRLINENIKNKNIIENSSKSSSNSSTSNDNNDNNNNSYSKPSNSRNTNSSSSKSSNRNYNNNSNSQKNKNTTYQSSVAQANKNIQNVRKATDNFSNTMSSIFSNYANSRAEQSNRERIAYTERKRREEAEEERERLKKEKLEREKLEKKRIEDAKYTFMNSLTDHNMPILAKQAITYFIIVAKNSREEIQFAKLNLVSNEQNELPYKIDVINEFKKQNNKQNVFLYGPYNNIQQQQSKLTQLKRDARNNYINIASDINYQTQLNKKTTTTPTNTDFWGNKKQPTKTTNKNSFWD